MILFVGCVVGEAQCTVGVDVRILNSTVNDAVAVFRGQTTEYINGAFAEYVFGQRDDAGGAVVGVEPSLGIDHRADGAVCPLGTNCRAIVRNGFGIDDTLVVPLLDDRKRLLIFFGNSRVYHAAVILNVILTSVPYISTQCGDIEEVAIQAALTGELTAQEAIDQMVEQLEEVIADVLEDM